MTNVEFGPHISLSYRFIFDFQPQGVTITLDDGSKESADVLVGSDGIWSAIRCQMYNEGRFGQL